MNIVVTIMAWLTLGLSLAALIFSVVAASMQRLEACYRNEYQAIGWAVASALFFMVSK